jgi:hypothetical protein
MLQLGRRFEIGVGSTFVAAVAATSLAATGYMRNAGFRWFASLLGFAPAAFVTAFIVQMPLAELIAAPPDLIEPVALSNTVVVVVFDEFPTLSLLDSEGLIDSSRYPNFARLADTATWYRNAATVHSHTAYAVPAILSGTYPGDKVPHYAAYPQSLFTLAGSSESVIREPFTHLCPPPICPEESVGSGLPSVDPLELALDLWRRLTFGAPEEEAGRYVDPFDELAAAAITANPDEMLSRVNAATHADPSTQFQTFIEDIRPNVLNFLHVLLPHGPFRYYPDGTQYNDFEVFEGVDRGSWSDESSALLGRQRHLLQVAHLDVLVGQLLDRLEREGWLDEAMLVVVADHGIAFESGQLLRAGSAENLVQIGLVPMFVKLPGQRQGSVDLRPVQTIDVLPTVASALRLPLQRAVEGQSLLNPEYVGVQQEVDDVSTGVHLLMTAHDAIESLASHANRIFPVPGTAGLFRPAPLGSWIGADLGQVATVVPGIGPGATLETASLLLNVSHSSGFVPGFVRGEVESDAQGLGVAVVENGQVLAVASLAGTSDENRRFATVIDPSLLSDGPHSFELYLVTSREGLVVRLDYSPPLLYELDEERGEIMDQSGRSYAVGESDEGHRGYVESVGYNPLHLASSSMYAIGWAVDDRRLMRAERVLAFADGRYVGVAVPDADLSDLVPELRDLQVTDAGFVLNVPYISDGDRFDLRVFAVWEGIAYELDLRDAVARSIGRFASTTGPP